MDEKRERFIYCPVFVFPVDNYDFRPRCDACGKDAVIRCSMCMKYLCLEHYYVEYYYRNCYVF